MTLEKYVPRSVVCDYFSISERQLYRWQNEGCPCIRIGGGGKGAPRFRLVDVEKWLETRAAVARR